jgi:diadenosine tetraphosphate (Ap4A) HIT family hydrolase
MNRVAKTAKLHAFLSECQFCAATSTRDGRRISRNLFAQAFLTNAPVVPGHTLIIPNRCIDTADAMTPSEFAAVFELVEELKPALRATFGADGFNYAWNEGAAAGQTVPHFHLHLLPRRAGDTGVLGYDPRSFFYRTGPRDPSPIEELSSVAMSIRSNLPNLRNAS